MQRILWPAFVLATILFYSILLFSPEASIHWDLADVYYPVQKYISDSLHSGVIPNWAPYLFSGTPLGSDPQSGLWYPLHWLFFAIGVTPTLMAWEIALHAFIALAGAFVLARRLFGDPITAALAGLFYAWGGFFAANSTQLPLFEAASLFPWLLWCAQNALEDRDARWLAAVGGVGGLIILTGDFDAASYCAFGLVCFLASQRALWKQAGIVMAAATVLGLAIGAIVILPWLGIAADTIRTGSDAEGIAGVNLQSPVIGTILSADYLGLLSGRYTGPDDVRHGYLYGGLLLIPLAVAGMVRRERVLALAALILPALWFAFGPAAGLFRVLAVFPAIRDARAPVEIWFVVTLGLALAAGSGAAFIAAGTGRKHLPYIFVVLTLADLWFWNFYRNPMVLAHVSYRQLYGRPHARFESSFGDLRKLPFARIWSAQPINAFGPLDGALPARLPVTYGYKTLEVQRHLRYRQILPENPRLMITLATHILDLAGGVIGENTAALGLVSVPAKIDFVATEAEARAKSLELNPADGAVVEAAQRPVSPATLTTTLVELRDSDVHLRYTASGDAFLRIGIPLLQGWRARIDDQPANLVPTDSVYLGLFVPSGSHEIFLTYDPPHRTLGLFLSLVGTIALFGVIRFAVR